MYQKKAPLIYLKMVTNKPKIIWINPTKWSCILSTKEIRIVHYTFRYTVLWECFRFEFVDIQNRNTPNTLWLGEGHEHVQNSNKSKSYIIVITRIV